MISSKKPDDKVGQGDDSQGAGAVQTPEQKAILGGGGETGGRVEPKSAEDWAARGASGGEPGRPPVAVGGNSQGQGDRMPAGPSGEPATNQKTQPGNPHEA